MTDETLTLKAADVVAAYVAHNAISAAELPDLLKKVIQTMHQEDVMPRGPQPAVPIEESVTHDYIVCLEDGAKVTLLGRYLKGHFQMTPEDYRAKWGLPEDYPFVAKAYSEKRSKIAKAQGLGRT